MKRLLLTVVYTFVCAVSATAFAKDPVAEIIELENRMEAMYNSEAFGKNPAVALEYFDGSKDVHMFDVMLPGEFVGDEFRKHMIELGNMATGKVKFLNYRVQADEKLAFVSYYQHYVGTTKNGKPFDMMLATTDCWKKIKGKWLIVHEHASLPVDQATFVSMFLPKK